MCELVGEKKGRRLQGSRSKEVCRAEKTHFSYPLCHTFSRLEILTARAKAFLLLSFLSSPPSFQKTKIFNNRNNMTEKRPQIDKGRQQETIKRCGQHLGELVERSIKTYPRQVPKGSRRDFLRLLPAPKFNDDWTREDEKALEIRMKQSREWDEFSKVLGQVIGVFKICYWLTKGLATDIIGVTKGLVYFSEAGAAKNNRWSLTFTQRLQVVIAHPFFQGQIPWIRMAIQWAAICRKDDHASHVFGKGCENDVFLRILAEVYQWQTGRHRPSTMRMLAHNLYVQRYSPAVSLWSTLMGHIEELACPEHEADRADDPTAPDVYKVSTEDVTTVITALDRMRGLAMFREDSRIIWETTQLMRSNHDVPLLADCKKAFQAVLLQEARLEEQCDLAAADDGLSLPPGIQSACGPLT